jgi:hypothetical protein
MCTAYQRVLFFIIAFCGISLLPHTLAAQTPSLPSNTATLSATTKYPEPGTPVTITLEAYTMNMVDATVVWFIDDIEQPNLRNERAIRLIAQELGTTQKIRARIIKPGERSVDASTIITSSNTDIVIEANTYIPSFYKGRALPSKSATIRAIAIPQNTEGGNPATYSYNWKYNDSTLYGGAVLGKQSIELSMPRYDSEVLSVIIYNRDGEVIGEDQIVLTAVEPELHFYESNPLRGMSRKALGTNFVLVGDEITVHGEPYFMGTDLSPQNAGYAWSINNIPVATPENPHVITLRRSETTGTVSIGLKIITNLKIPQVIEGLFSIFTR